MQKRIGVKELRLGMFIMTFGGAWISHPFWRDHFLLERQSDLVRIRNSGVRDIWIDTAKGEDVTPAPAGVPGMDDRSDAVDGSDASGLAIPAVAPVRLEDEVRQAREICARSKVAITAMFDDARMGQAVMGGQANALVEEISDSVARNPDAFINLVRLKTADEYTYMHSVAVCALMIALATQLQLPPAQVREAGVAGLLHDIGKMAIPDAILNKPGQLTDAEFTTVRNHPVAGSRLLQGSGVSAAVVDVCLHHHEKMDGTGYPDGLHGEEISLLARMGAICDVYDAVTSDRSYHRGWAPAEAIRKMASWKGHFDETLFQAFLKAIGIYPVGSLVRLNSGRLAVVMEQHKKSLLTPKVKVFMSARTRMPILQEVVDLSKFVGSDKIVGIESPEAWGVANLDALWTGLPQQDGYFG